MRFSGKRVLITGSTRGIGRATALAFHREGAEVILNYKSSADSAASALRELKGSARAIRADMGSPDDISRLIEDVRSNSGSLDFLVNNVGIVKPQGFASLSLDDWNHTIATNLTGTFLSCQGFLPLILDSGCIVNISSLRGLDGFGRPPITDYSVSKAAVISLTKTLAKYAAPRVRVNCVSPGFTKTEIASTYPPELVEKFRQETYLDRLIEPEEIASVVLFLCSTEASAITGVNIPVDGGQSLSH